MSVGFDCGFVGADPRVRPAYEFVFMFLGEPRVFDCGLVGANLVFARPLFLFFRIRVTRFLCPTTYLLTRFANPASTSSRLRNLLHRTTVSGSISPGK